MFSLWVNRVELDGGLTICALSHNRCKGLTVDPVFNEAFADHILGFWVLDNNLGPWLLAFNTWISIFYTAGFNDWSLPIFNFTRSDWIFALVGLTLCISWVELDGGDTVFALLNNWNKGLTVCTVLAV